MAAAQHSKPGPLPLRAGGLSPGNLQRSTHRVGGRGSSFFDLRSWTKPGADADTDGCDDCAIGVDGFGPLADNDPSNDGADTDSNGFVDDVHGIAFDLDGVANPDMLHQGILPHHTLWVKLFENLRYVVVDEVHQYRGVFGSHVANVLRRLRRIAAGTEHGGGVTKIGDDNLIMAGAHVGHLGVDHALEHDDVVRV